MLTPSTKLQFASGRGAWPFSSINSGQRPNPKINNNLGCAEKG